MATALTLRILGAQDQGILDAFEFYGGEKRTMTLQLVRIEDDQKWVIPADVSDVEVIVSGTPDDISLKKSGGFVVIDSVDKSVMTVNLSTTATAAMITGNIQAKVSSPTIDTIYARLDLSLKRLRKISE